MKINEDFKISAAKAYSIIKNLIILVLFGFLMYEYITTDEEDGMRMYVFKTPFSINRFYQEIK